MGQHRTGGRSRARSRRLPYCSLMQELEGEHAGDGDIGLQRTRSRVIRIAAVVAAAGAAALWISVAQSHSKLFSAAGIAAGILSSLFAVTLPLAVRVGRVPAGRPQDGTRIAAVAAAAVMIIGGVTLANHYAVAARFAEGTRGIFQVEDVICSQNCSLSGFFFVRERGKWITLDSDYTIAAGPGQTVKLAGHDVPAIDTGDPNQVYPADGGSQWIAVRITAIATSGIACSLIAALLVLRYRRTRRKTKLLPELRLP
jgi:hypothetical protein